MSMTERIARKVPTDSLAPYVDWALHDDELRKRAKKAYASGQDVYGKLRTEPDLADAVGRLASDEKPQRETRASLAELLGAARRIGRRRIGRRPSRRRQRLRALVVAAAVAFAVFTASRRAAKA